jgi:hypothetical protein
MKSAVLHQQEEQDVWSSHLQDVFDSLNIPRGVMADNITPGIASYCRQFHPHGLSRQDLILLVARAFCALNEKEAARIALGSVRPHMHHAERWLEILSELHHFPALLPYFSRGIIRPADWTGAQLDRMWTLDFDRLLLGEADRHEMTLYRTIRVLVQNMYAFWDVTRGEGVLGLKGLAGLNLEPAAKKNKGLTEADQLLAYISDLFAAERERRGWKAIPSMLNVDL